MNQYARRRVREHRRSYYGNLLMAALIFLIVAVIVLAAKMFSATISMGGFSRLERFELPSLLSEAETADLERGWNLILVNSKHRIPKGYEVELIRLSNGKQVDERIYPELQEMFDAARANGLHLFVAEGYRTQKGSRWISMRTTREAPMMRSIHGWPRTVGSTDLSDAIRRTRRRLQGRYMSRGITDMWEKKPPGKLLRAGSAWRNIWKI